MPAAALPANEHSRQTLLEALGVLDSAPEDDYRDIVRIASQICGVPSARISLVDRKRQWFKAQVGTELDQTSREVSFCAHAILQPDQVLHVPDTRTDARFSDNPMAAEGGVRFYAGAPVLVDGLPLGTVCVVDEQPRELTPGQLDALAALARQAARVIEFRRLGRVASIQLRERDWYERTLRDHHRQLTDRTGDDPWDPGRVDAVTGLPGQAAFQELVDEELWLLQGTGTPLHVALIEIDGLDTVDAIHGPSEAQSLLATLAKVLRSGQAVEGRVARIGPGLAVFMPATLTQATAQCARVSELMGSSAAGLPVTLSVGIACIEDGENGSDALECATHALAQARGAGGNRIEVR